ncbi:MAG TPA: hypothetical protein VHE61_02240 [Opitutaceae bacterium]|nr:hypothetical protein [Opitutaceae bacterium]
MQADFMDRPPTEQDPLQIGIVDLCGDAGWQPLAETRAWNWQQGCMLQWLNGGREGRIIFNDRRDGRFVSRIIDVRNGTEQLIDRPVYGVNALGTVAVSLNFSRLQHQRPGYGYPGVPDAWAGTLAPSDDGLHAVDLRTGASRLILSVAAAAARDPRPEFADRMHRFNHAQFSPGGVRFACLHRWKTPDEEVGHTRLLTMDSDGSDLRCLADEGLVSHYDWCDDRRVLAWATHCGRDRYFLFDETGSASPVGEGVLTCDGHCSYSPDRRWILTDTYPDREQHRTLLLFHVPTGRRVDIGRFLSPSVDWQIRCDLHPRWSPDGRHVCIDSIHEGSRQMYVLDIADIIGAT